MKKNENKRVTLHVSSITISTPFFHAGKGIISAGHSILVGFESNWLVDPGSVMALLL
jgi:hypothetical protein